MNNDLLNQVTVKNTFVHVNQAFCDTTDGSSTTSENAPSSQSSPGGNVVDNNLAPPQLTLGRSNSAPADTIAQQIQFLDPNMAVVVQDPQQSFAALNQGVYSNIVEQSMEQTQQVYTDQAQMQAQENNAYITGSSMNLQPNMVQAQDGSVSSGCDQQQQMIFLDQQQQQQQQDFNNQFQQAQYMAMPQVQNQMMQPMQQGQVVMMDQNQLMQPMQQTVSPNSMVSPQECRVVYVQGNFAQNNSATNSPQLHQAQNGSSAWRIAQPMFNHSNSVCSSDSQNGQLFNGVMNSPSQQPLSSVPMVVNPQNVQGQIAMPQNNMVCPPADMPIDMNNLPSIGSAGHAFGTCKRCCFHPKGRCVNGASCLFCHFPHEKRIRRSKKSKRSRTSTNMTDFSAGSPGLSQMADGAFIMQQQQQPQMMMQNNMMTCQTVQSPGNMMQNMVNPYPLMQPQQPMVCQPASNDPSPVCQNPNQLQF
jgi:hypothetical protein